MEPLLDAYQFPLSSTASDLPERLDCERTEQQQAAKWAKWHKQRKLPPKDTLKKLCRKVSLLKEKLIKKLEGQTCKPGLYGITEWGK